MFVGKLQLCLAPADSTLSRHFPMDLTCWDCGSLHEVRFCGVRALSIVAFYAGLHADLVQQYVRGVEEPLKLPQR